MTAMLMMTVMIMIARGEREENAIDAAGSVVFLHDELDPSASGWPRPQKWKSLRHGNDAETQADAVGADAILHPRGDFALEEDHVGDAPEHDEVDHDGDVEPHGDVVLNPIARCDRMTLELHELRGWGGRLGLSRDERRERLAHLAANGWALYRPGRPSSL
jgi:hypothetical protein